VYYNTQYTVLQDIYFRQDSRWCASRWRVSGPDEIAEGQIVRITAGAGAASVAAKLMCAS
jgi:hypothetical protein